MSSELSNISQSLTAAFIQREKERGPCEDPVWSKVQKIALNCLQTGVCVLTGDALEKVHFRQIPPEKTAELHIAKVLEDSSMHDDVIQSIVDEIYTAPNRYYPRPFMVHKWRIETESERYFSKLMRASFIPYRETYELDDQGVPNTPGDVLEIIDRENILYVLLKGQSDSQQKWDVFFGLAKEKVRPFYDILPVLARESSTDLTRFPEYKALKDCLSDPYCILDALIEKLSEDVPEEKREDFLSAHRNFFGAVRDGKFERIASQNS